MLPRKSRPSPLPPLDPKRAHERDAGYNESHGYGPAHGGPTGPGDAPAPPSAPITTPDACEDEEDEALAG